VLSLHFSSVFGIHEESRRWGFGLLYLKDAFFTTKDRAHGAIKINNLHKQLMGRDQPQFIE